MRLEKADYAKRERHEYLEKEDGDHRPEGPTPQREENELEAKAEQSKQCQGTACRKDKAVIWGHLVEVSAVPFHPRLLPGCRGEDHTSERERKANAHGKGKGFMKHEHCQK